MSAIGRRRRNVFILLLIFCLGAAVPLLKWWSRHKKEQFLRDDLATMRGVLQQYTLDKHRTPQAIEDLIQGGYIREIPKDPITGDANWVVELDDAIIGTGQFDIGIWNVHSRSKQTALDGTKYSDW